MPIDAVSHSIQLAVAPVFMLTAIAALIGSLATRLARIIDRARTLDELARLRKRGLIVNTSMTLLTLAGTLIGATILALFLGETVSSETRTFVPWTFLGGVLCFVFSLLFFLFETFLAGRSLNFGSRGRRSA
jgi:hypothetical protein